MRHLYFIGHGSVPPVSGSRQHRFVTTVHHVLAAVALMAITIPLHAQKISPARTAASHEKPSPAATASKATVPVTAAAPTPTPAPGNDSYNVSLTTVLRDAPGSAAIGELKKTANVDVIARDRGWTRIRIEGWVPDSVLTPADTTYRAGLSAADLRADPAAARGKTVVWTVEFLALQTADPLRHGLADEEPYILARGPKSENALLYLVVPPSLMGTARALQPLTKVTVTARVRDGRSEPVGIPILDIQTLRRIR